MSNLIKILIALSALTFLVAVLEALFSFQLLRVDPEGFSRACSNLALIAIALAVVYQKS